jgi:hypothetical protein
LGLGTTFQVPAAGALCATNEAAHASNTGNSSTRRVVCVGENFFMSARFNRFIDFHIS